MLNADCRYDNMKTVTVSEGSVLQNRFGGSSIQTGLESHLDPIFSATRVVLCTCWLLHQNCGHLF